jgi:hypothetical protein
MKNNLTFIKVLTLILLSIPLDLSSQNSFECSTSYTPPFSVASGLSTTCEFTNLTTSEYLEIPIVYIPVVFHFVADETGDNFICNPSTWSPRDAEWMANELIKAANNDVFDGPTQNGTGGSLVPDTRIRLQLALNQTNSQCDGIWIYNSHLDNPSVNYSNDVLDIVIEDNMPLPPPGSPLTIGGSTQGPNSTWARGNNILNYIQRGGSNPIWLHGRSIAHEVSHILDLPHSFSCWNNCSQPLDVQQCNSNPYGSCEPSWGGVSVICPWGVGNNLMGYNGNQTALTGCQWETMINHLWTNPPNYIDWCSDIQADLNITTNTTWDGPKIMNRNVFVKNGVTLTVKDCELRMGAGKFIRVEKGGQLIVDEATITKHCDDFWRGIEVLGDPNLAQTPANQGKVVLSNNSNIEYASEAVMLHWNAWGNTGGGIIEADDTEFYNNKRAVSYVPYANDNVSYFSNCTFEIDDDLPASSYIGMMTMWDVKGVDITNCTFVNNNRSPLHNSPCFSDL